jgi:hypothetical protein
LCPQLTDATGCSLLNLTNRGESNTPPEAK